MVWCGEGERGYQVHVMGNKPSGEKKTIFGRNTLELSIFMDSLLLPPLSTLTEGSNVKGISGPIRVRIFFENYRSL